jgi:hypothetical protein
MSRPEQQLIIADEVEFYEWPCDPPDSWYRVYTNTIREPASSRRYIYVKARKKPPTGLMMVAPDLPTQPYHTVTYIVVEDWLPDE